MHAQHSSLSLCLSLSLSGRVRALNLTVPLGSGRVGSDDLGYGPGSGFSFEPVQTSTPEPKDGWFLHASGQPEVGGFQHIDERSYGWEVFRLWRLLGIDVSVFRLVRVWWFLLAWVQGMILEDWHSLVSGGEGRNYFDLVGLPHMSVCGWPLGWKVE